MPLWNDPRLLPPRGETDDVQDTLRWYRDLFERKPRPIRLLDDHEQAWGFLRDEVDPRVREKVELLCRGNRKRVLEQLKTNLSLDVGYRCLEGQSVGEGVALDFETAVAEWVHRPNFDAPPCPPPTEPKELANWFKSYVGTCGWIAEQVGLREIDVRNALAGRSKRHLPPIHELAERFYKLRANMDVRNERYQDELSEYEAEVRTRAWVCYGHAKQLYAEACDAWAASEEKQELEQFVADGGDRREFISELLRKRIPEVETHTFRTWCEANKRLISNTTPYPTPTRPCEWDQVPWVKRVDPEAH